MLKTKGMMQGMWRWWRRCWQPARARTSATPRAGRPCTALRPRGSWRWCCVWSRQAPHRARAQTLTSSACSPARPPTGCPPHLAPACNLHSLLSQHRVVHGGCMLRYLSFIKAIYKGAMVFWMSSSCLRCSLLSAFLCLFDLQL